jgi:hypothetical protein
MTLGSLSDTDVRTILSYPLRSVRTDPLPHLAHDHPIEHLIAHPFPPALGIHVLDAGSPDGRGVGEEVVEPGGLPVDRLRLPVRSRTDGS